MYNFHVNVGVGKHKFFLFTIAFFNINFYIYYVLARFASNV